MSAAAEGAIKRFSMFMVIPPAILDSDLEKNLLRQLKAQVENQCTKTKGFISQVLEITRIGEIRITAANSEAVAEIDYLARVLTPILGEKMQGTVTKNSQFGVFVTLNQMMQVLIPVSKMRKLGEVSYSQNTATFTIERDDEVVEITEGDFVDVIIDDYSFEHNRLACIGSLSL